MINIWFPMIHDAFEVPLCAQCIEGHYVLYASSFLLQKCLDMPQSDNLQKARRATTPCVSWSVALLHILQVVQVVTNLQ